MDYLPLEIFSVDRLPNEILSIISEYAADTNLKYCNKTFLELYRSGAHYKKVIQLLRTYNSLTGKSQTICENIPCALKRFKTLILHNNELFNLYANVNCSINKYRDAIPLEQAYYFPRMILSSIIERKHHNFTITSYAGFCKIHNISIKSSASIAKIHILVCDITVYDIEGDDLAILDKIGVEITIPPYWGIDNYCNISIELLQSGTTSISYDTYRIDTNNFPVDFNYPIMMAQRYESITDVNHKINYLVIDVAKYCGNITIMNVFINKLLMVRDWRIVDNYLVLNMEGIIYKLEHLHFMVQDQSKNIIVPYNGPVLSVFTNIWRTDMNTRLSILRFWC